jgi:PmbA protein
MSDYSGLIDHIINKVTESGADEAEVFLEVERESQVGTRLGEIETLKESISRGLGIRVFTGKRQGFVYTSDFQEAHIDGLIVSAIELAKQTSVDEFNGLTEPADDTADNDLELYDPAIPRIEQKAKIEMCQAMEKTMFAFDNRVKNSDGGYFFDGNSEVYIGNSYGLRRHAVSSHCYLQCAPVAEQDGKFQAGYWYSIKRNFAELDTPENVATIAAGRAVRMLGATTPKTARVPVVFDPLTGAAVIGNILMAINGDSIYKRSTFLVDKLGETIGSPLVNIRDDARLKRMIGSSPFDGEGMPTSDKAIVSQGKLVSYLYDNYTARKAGAKATANAQRNYSSTPSIGGFNFYLEEGKHTPGEIIGSVKNGLYITDIMGYGADMATGDYSQGASGIWIENGKLTRPVEGITIASDIFSMLKGISMIGNDLDFIGPVASPTFKIDLMTVAGS